jgi:uncharacterized protein (DUF1330 family)
VVADPGRFNQLRGLQVDDQESYAQYRAAMTPLLHACGGAFGVDLEVSRVLKSPVAHGFNRVFTLGFPSRAVSEAFFADPKYLAVRARFFEPAVSAVVLLGEWGE